jgi:uncharacterized protein YjbI with pentapeptide repeats
MVVITVFAVCLGILGVAVLWLSVRSRGVIVSRLLQEVGVAVLAASLLTGGGMLITQWLNEESTSEATRRDNARFIREAVLSNAETLPFAGMDLSGRVIGGLELKGANLFGSNLNKADLSWADLSCQGDIAWTEAVPEHRLVPCSDLGRISAPGVESVGTNFEGSSFHSADLRGGSLRSATLSHALSTKADFSGADLRLIKAKWANFAGADFSNADLSGSDIENSSFSGICYNENTRWPQGFTPPGSPFCQKE